MPIENENLELDASAEPTSATPAKAAAIPTPAPASVSDFPPAAAAAVPVAAPVQAAAIPVPATPASASAPASAEALTPAATEAKAESVAVTKASMAAGKCFVAAMLAGAFIGFGGMFFCLFLGDPTMPFAVQRLVGGLCFCLGLTLVLCCGAELFTGNVLMICAKASRKITWGGLFRNWGIVWVGNLVGALVAVLVVYLTNLQGMNGGAVGEAFVSVAAGKVALDPLTLFCKAIMCNVLVCLAVWIGFSAKTVADKVLGLLFPICAFVACGFEHCVANMFFLPMGLALNLAGFGAAGAVTLGGIVYNLVFATLGNLVGGLVIGLAYWFIYAKTK